MKLNTTAKKQDDMSQVENVTMSDVSEVREEPVEDLSGMSFEDKIIYWKNKYKKIFRTRVGGEDYIWRRITRKEYAEIALANNPDGVTNKQLDMYEKQFKFCAATVLYPENIVEIMNESAGLCATLGDEIIFASGFGELYPKTVEVGSEEDKNEAN